MFSGASSRASLLALPMALALAACTETVYSPVAPSVGPVTGPVAGASGGMDGNWSSSDGVFVATFAGGIFTSRFTQTNEILAQGTYQVSGSSVALEWISVATQQTRSATCTIASANAVTCVQAGGGSFSLNRVA